MKIQRKKTLKHISRRKYISRRKSISRRRQSKQRYSRKMKGGNPFCKKYKTKIEQLEQTIETLKEENEKLKPLETAAITQEDTYATLRTPPPAGYYAELLHTKSPTTPSFHTTPAGPNAPSRMVMSPSRPELPRPRDIPKFNLEESSA